MRKPSPDDMIYAGLVLRLGLVNEEEMRGLTMLPGQDQLSFVEIMLRRGIVSQAQHRVIQDMVAGLAAAPEFSRRAGGAPLHAPEIDQLGLPTVIQGAPAGPSRGDTRPLAGQAPVTAPAAPIARPVSSPPAPPAPVPAMDATSAPDDLEAPTVLGGGTAPPAAVAAAAAMGADQATLVLSGTTGGPRTATLDATSFGASVTREDIDRARRAIERHGDSLLGTQIAGYVLLDKLGKGGMGEVYLAKQLALDRYVAFKVLPPSLASNADFVDRFVKEARTLGRVNFPSVVQVYDVGVEGGVVYFTMELVRGRTVQDIIKENRTVPLPLAINIIKQTCRALARVAREGIIHRDIKPGNIMVTDEGEVKVCDFGIAAEKIDARAVAEIAGTAYYIAPEILMGTPASSESDQYALGVTFYHMLAGLPSGKTSGSFAGLLETADLPPLADADSSIPVAVSNIVRRMMDPEPEKRWRRFAEVFKQLEDHELRAGLIKAPSDFLADRLVEMNKQGLESLKRWIAILSMIGLGYTGMALALNRILIGAGLNRIVGLAAGWGTILIVVAYLMILYVGLARKRKLPAIGQLSVWVRTHYSIALVGYFLVMVHSGNFLGVPSVKKALAPVPGLGAATWNDVPTVAFLSSAGLFVVIVSGLIGRYIFRELHKQVAVQQFGRREGLSAEERSQVTSLVMGARIMGAWRILHYPFTLFMILMLLLHVVSTMFYGAAFFGGR